MAKRQITLTFEIDEDVARQMERMSIFNNPERFFGGYVERTHSLMEFFHELGNCLAPVRGYTHIVYHGMAGELNDMQREFLGIVMQNLEQIKKLMGE